VPPLRVTRLEGLLLAGGIAVLASLVVVVGCSSVDRQDGLMCINNVSNLVGLLERTAGNRDRYPPYPGPNLLLHYAVNGELDSRDLLGLLFCPVDEKESLGRAGGPAAYRELDLTQGGHGHLTSYAGRDWSREATRARPGDRDLVLLADDSDDHHGRGFVVGLSGGRARWWDKRDRWGLAPGTPVTVGAASRVEEFRPLRAE